MKIEINENKIVVEGDGSELLAGLETLVGSLKQAGISEEMLKLAFENGLLSEAERTKKIKNELNDFLNKLMELSKKMED